MMNDSSKTSINVSENAQCSEENTPKNVGSSSGSVKIGNEENNKDTNSISSANENTPKRGRGRPCKRTAENIGSDINEEREDLSKRLYFLSDGEHETSTSWNQRSRSKSLPRQGCRGQRSKKIPSRYSSPIFKDELCTRRGRSRSHSRSNRRGRPPKRNLSVDSDSEEISQGISRSKSLTRPKRRSQPSVEEFNGDNKSIPTSKRRGRPSKIIAEESSHEEVRRGRSRSKSASRPKRRGRPYKNASAYSSPEEETRRSRSKSVTSLKQRGRPSKRYSSSESYSDDTEDQTSIDLHEENKNRRCKSVSKFEHKKSLERLSSVESLSSNGEGEEKKRRESLRNTNRNKSIFSFRHKNNDVSTGSSMNSKSSEKEDLRNPNNVSTTRTRSRSVSRFKRDESQSETDRKSEDLSEPSSKKLKLTPYKPLPQITGNKDIFCWQCHRDGSTKLTCHICPRTYHKRCAKIDSEPETWVCIECNAGMKAGSFQGRSEAMKALSQEKFNQLLKFVMERIYSHEGADHFKYPVNLSEYEKYRDFIINPMDLSLMDKNINNSKYQSTESFLADLKWLVHNSYIFNSAYSELTSFARGIMKIAKQETEEVENCPNCYYHYHTMDDDAWFVEPCKKPHLLVWAKLRGFPHWPAKIMRMVDDMVDVRFFGDHNRAWLPPEACYLFSKSPPFLTKTGKQCGYDECIKEIFIHIKKLKDKFGEFNFATLRIKYFPSEHMKQLSDMLPAFKNNKRIVGNQTNFKIIEEGSKKKIDNDGGQLITPLVSLPSRKSDVALEKVGSMCVAKNLPEKNVFTIHPTSTQCTLKPERIPVPALQVIKSPIQPQSLEDKSISLSKFNSSSLYNGRIGNNSPGKQTKVYVFKRVQDAKSTTGADKIAPIPGIIKILKKSISQFNKSPLQSVKNPANPSTLASSEEVISSVEEQSKGVSLLSDQKNSAMISTLVLNKEVLNSPSNDQSKGISITTEQKAELHQSTLSMVKSNTQANHDGKNVNDSDHSFIEIKEEHQDFTESPISKSSPQCKILNSKEPRIVLTKISYTDEFSKEADASVTSVGKESETEENKTNINRDKTDELNLLDSYVGKKTVENATETSHTSKTYEQFNEDDNTYLELLNDFGSNEENVEDKFQKDSSVPIDQMKEIDEDIPAGTSSSLIRVKSSIELLSSEALKRHTTQENQDDNHMDQNEVSMLNDLSSGTNGGKQVKPYLPPLPEMEIIKINEEKEAKSPLLEHVSASIEKVISGNTSVSVASLLSQRKLKKKNGKSEEAILVDSESSNDEEGFTSDNDELDEEMIGDVDINPDLDFEMINQNIVDISAWSIEPYVENSTVLSSMNEIFSSIEKAQSLDLCKNLMIKFKKFAFLQSAEMKSFYLKTKNETTEICNMFKLEHEKLINQKKEVNKKIKKIKLTQWCSFCLKEANFYCCWGTSYCSNECQLKDWEKHYDHCKQSDKNQQDNDHLRMANPGKNTISLAPSVTLSKVSSDNKQATVQKTASETVSLQLHTKSINTASAQTCVIKPVLKALPFNPKSIGQKKFISGQILSTPQINTVGPTYIATKPLEILTSQPSKTLSNPSRPFILHKANQVYKICSNKTNDQNKILVQNERLKSTSDSVQANVYNMPLTTSSSLVKKTTGQYEKVFIVNKNSLPCLIRPVVSSSASGGVGKMFLKSSRVPVDSLAHAGTRAS